MTRQLEGFRELEKKLEKLGALERGKVIRSGVTAAGNPVVKQAKATIPVGKVPHTTYKGRLVGPGFAKRSIAKRVSLSRDRNRAEVRVGVKAEAFYAVAFLEKGTSKMRRQPWLEPAFRATREQQVDAFRDKVRDFILKFTR